MTVPYAFSAATSAIPLSQLDDNFNTTITLGNTAIQLGNTVTTLNNMTLANVTISSGNVTLTNVTVTTANATTVNTTTLIATTANVTTVNATNINVATTSILNYGTANGVAYLNTSKALTTGTALWFDGTNFGVGTGGNTLNHQSVLYKGGANSVYFQVGNGSTGLGATQGLRLGVTSAGLGELYSVTSMTSYIDGTGAMFLNSTGLVVGNTSVSAKLEGWYTSTAPSLSSSTGAGLSLRGTSTLRVNIGSDPSSPFGGWIQASDGGGTSFPLNLNPLGGNVGVGTSSPGASLDVYMGTGNSIIRAWAASGTPRFDIRSATRYYSISIQSDNLTFFDESDGSTRMTLLANGNYGIGTTSPNRKLEIGGTSNALMGFNSTSNRRYTIGSDANGFSVYDDTAAAYRTVIDSSGNFLVGRTTAIASEKLSVEGSATTFISRFRNTSATTPSGIFVSYTAAAPNDTGNLFFRADDNAATRAEIRSNGGIANYSGNNVNLSDRREKTNFAPAKSYLDTICAIPVQTFNYIDQSEDDPGLTLGVVAQDVQAVAPELVMESNWGSKDDPKMRLSIYQTDLQYAMMKALQELKAEFDAYKATHP